MTHTVELSNMLLIHLVISQCLSVFYTYRELLCGRKLESSHKKASFSETVFMYTLYSVYITVVFL